MYSEQPLGGWAEKKHRSGLYMFVLSEGVEEVFPAPGPPMSG